MLLLSNYSRYYNSKPLEWDYVVILYWVIQENSIESSLQNSLSYIPLQIVHASYCASYPNDHV